MMDSHGKRDVPHLPTDKVKEGSDYFFFTFTEGELLVVEVE